MSQLTDQQYRRLFESAAGKTLVLRPDSYEILAASKDYLNVTMTREEDIVGKNLFEVFPDAPDDPKADGTHNLRASLQRVRSFKAPDIMGVQRYPIPTPSGGFEERFWSPVNTPVLDGAGDIEFIIHRVEDVTGIVHPQPEGSLTQAEQLLQLAGQKVRLGGWCVELDSEVVIWTRETAAIHGKPAGFSPASVEEGMGFYAPEHRGLILNAFQNCIQYGKEFDVICQLDTATTQRIWVRVIGAPERDEHGRIIAVQGAFQDISKLREAEDRADQADRQRIHILESISDAFFALDENWNFSYLNRQAEVLLERSRVDLLGRNVWTEFPTAVGSTFQRQYQHALENQQTVEFREFYPPLNKWLDVSAYPIPDGLAVYFRDITQRKQQEAELLLNQERFRLISKATNDVIWDWNFDAGTVWWNDSMYEVFGHQASDLEPGPESWTRRIHPDDLDRVYHSIHEVIDGPVDHWTEEYRFIKGDGQYATVIDRGFVIREPSGKAIRMLGSMLDITERMELETRLRESQKLEAVGHLTGGVAHDFNNLLTVIMGNSEELAERLTDRHLRLMAEMTVSAAARGAELTNRLLAFARRQPLEPKPMNVNRLVGEMEALIRRTLPENIQFEFLGESDLKITEVDANQLDTALLNLVINARDAMPNGGKLTIETGNAWLDDEYAARHQEVSPGEYVMICVSDTGIGMDEDTQNSAFEPFFTTKAIGKGSGLGLSMVFGFTKQTGGHIKIYSEQGEGTSVKLYFPSAEALQESSDIDETEQPMRGGDEHILIAEDDDLVREHLTGQLQTLGYRVTSVGSGPAALAALHLNSDISLLLTDIIMPGGMNGRELSNIAQGKHPALRVLYTSGYTENAIVHHGRLDPGVDLLSKPYRRRDLALKVRKVLDGDRNTVRK
ncbi:MAG: PAS domain-containing protein [Marinobacter sp.]|uniref:PAS domain-containing protein n=1 Tax=Marinobacter sp. TaxID=50741 RepID=UPI0034A07DB1